MARPRFLPDNFMLMLLATVALASLLPARGVATQWLGYVTTVAISLLFFLHGAKLSRSAILAGLGHWRAHLMVFSATFLLFPLIGWGLQPVLAPLVTPDLYTGFLFLCLLPSTVQSSIALTALARGNMPAAICAASASTLLGIVITPLLVGLLLSKGAAMGDPLAAVGRISMQLLLPFIAGHLLQPLIGGFVKKNASLLKIVDQGSILLVVYAAFSQAVIGGLWMALPVPALAGLAVLCACLLALVLSLLTWACRSIGFSKEDEISIVFCGSQKSLISGVPMANVLFTASVAGAIVLPLMVYHQMQLMVCAALARRYAQRPLDPEDAPVELARAPKKTN
jgi:sodium/bile acid cotransporter 7